MVFRNLWLKDFDLPLWLLRFYKVIFCLCYFNSYYRLLFHGIIWGRKFENTIKTTLYLPGSIKERVALYGEYGFYFLPGNYFLKLSGDCC
jgi:hypothetical protein